MYDLVEQGAVEQVDGVPTFSVRSAGAIFPIMPEAELSALGG
jgi:uncharacterized protein